MYKYQKIDVIAEQFADIAAKKEIEGTPTVPGERNTFKIEEFESQICDILMQCLESHAMKGQYEMEAHKTIMDALMYILGNYTPPEVKENPIEALLSKWNYHARNRSIPYIVGYALLNFFTEEEDTDY